MLHPRALARLSAIATAVSFAVALVVPAATAATAPTTDPGSPYGSNDWSCRPTPARPFPVILVHGTYGSQSTGWNYMSWFISANGFCVFSLDYGRYGTNSVAQSAGELDAFVDKVLAVTGADRVSIVGHSQGGMMPRYYIKNLGGADKVEDLVAIVPSNHGTTWTPLLTLVPNFYCRACYDQMAGSTFLTNLNAGDETPGDVDYTDIVTEDDVVVTPYTSGFLTGPRVTNVTIQDLCPTDTVDHVGAPSDPAVIRLTMNALLVNGPANPAYQPRCTW